MPTNEDLDQRLVELETKASFTDVSLEQLSETIYQQQKQIDALKRLLEALEQQLKATQSSVKEGGEWKPEDEIPPHY